MTQLVSIFSFSEWFFHLDRLLFDLKTTTNGVQLGLIRGCPKDKVKERQKEFIVQINSKIHQLNKFIEEFESQTNKHMKYINLPQLERLDKGKFEKLIKSITPLQDYSPSYKDLGTTERDENFRLKVDLLIQPLLLSMQNMRLEIKQFTSFFPKDIDKINKRYIPELCEARDIFSIGHYGTAVFLVGKTLERILRDYLHKLKLSNKINYTYKEINSWDFETMINILGKEKVLSPSRKAKISAIKWDRNIFGHPNTKTEVLSSLKDAKAMIILGVNQIIYFDKRKK